MIEKEKKKIEKKVEKEIKKEEKEERIEEKKKPTETPKVKKEEIKPKDEVIYTIPLREAFYVERTRRTNKAVNVVKKFLMKHKKIDDIKKIKLDNLLNEYLWKRGREKPPRKVKVKAWKEGDILKATLATAPD